MSKNNNANPGQYKTKGRERPGKDVLHERNKELESIQAHELREQARNRQKKNRRGTSDR